MKTLLTKVLSMVCFLIIAFLAIERAYYNH